METEYKRFKKDWTPKTVLDVVLTPVQPTPTRSHEHACRFWADLMLSTRRSNAFPSDGIAWDACWNKVQTTSSFYEAFGGHFLFAVCKERVRIAGMQEQVSPCGGVRRRQVSTGSGSSNQYDINLKHKELLSSWKSCATTKNYALWPWETPNAITFTRHFTHCSILIFGVFQDVLWFKCSWVFLHIKGVKELRFSFSPWRDRLKASSSMISGSTQPENIKGIVPQGSETIYTPLSWMHLSKVKSNPNCLSVRSLEDSSEMRPICSLDAVILRLTRVETESTKAAAPPCGSTEDAWAARCTAGKLYTSQADYTSTSIIPPSTLLQLLF